MWAKLYFAFSAYPYLQQFLLIIIIIENKATMKSGL